MAVAVLVAVIITGETADRVAVVRQTDRERRVLTVTAQQVKEMRAGIIFTGVRVAEAVGLDQQDKMGRMAM